jgi:site-specific DNA recombinase
MKVVLYTRVSTQEQAEFNTSLESQAEQLEAFSKSQGWVVFNTYTDPGFSGKDGNRPALKRMMEDAKLGCFEKILVWRLDRLARNLRVILEIEAHLREQSVGILSLRELVDTSSPIGRTVFQVLGLAAEWERESIAERTKTGRIQRFKEGKWAASTAPYGYSYNKETKTLILNVETSLIVQKIYSLYADGSSLSHIANILNSESVKPRRKDSQGWRETGIRQVLVNPIYKGMAIVNRHSHISDINKIDLTNTIQVPTIPIVSTEKWDIAQSRLAGNKQSRPMAKDDFILQGFIKCGLCGYSYRTNRTNGKRRYECRGRLKKNHLDHSPKCATHPIDAAWLEDEVWKRIIDIINDPNKLEPLLKESIDSLTRREQELETILLPVEKRLKEVADQKAKLADKWVQENLDVLKYKSMQEHLDKEESRLIALRRDTDPNKLVELETTRGMLKFWQSQVESMEWNAEEDVPDKRVMVRSVDKPHQNVLSLIGFGDKDLSQTMHFPATQRELLDKLQVKLVVFEDRIEVNAVFPIEAIKYQKCTLPFAKGRPNIK